VSETPPVSEIPPVPELNTEAVNAWLEETSIKDIDAVKRLDPVQQDTLARIAQINRRMAYLLVTYQPLINIAGPGELLDRVRTLMKSGSRDWTRLFDDTSLFSKEARFIRRALRILDAAAGTVATAAGRGLKIKSSITNIQWQSLPQEARIYMERRLRPYLDKQTSPIETMARTTMVDIISPGDEVVEVITTSKTSPAFGIFDQKEFFARRQIRPFQLLLAAKEVGARSIRFVLYGEPLFDEKYAEKLLEAAKELQLGVVIVHVDHSTGDTRYLFGETAARPEPKGTSIKRLPPLSAPRRLKMKAPPQVQAEATTLKPDKDGKIFADYFRAESTSDDPAAAAWTVAMRRASSSAALPGSVRDVIGRLLGEEGRSITPEAGLRTLDEAVWKEMERIFSPLGRIDDAIKALLESIPESVEPKAFEEAYAIREALADAREELETLKIDTSEIDRKWAILRHIGELVHPERMAELFGGTLGETEDIYGNDYLAIEDRLQAIEARLSAAEAGLSEAMMSISVRDFLTSARGTGKTIAALRTTIARAGRMAGELAGAVVKQVVTPTDVFDVARMTYEPFPQLDGVAGLKRELAEIINEAGRYKDVVEGNAEFVEALERVVAETGKLMEEMAAVQAQYDSAKGEHAGAAGKLRQMARDVELSLEPTADTGLPPPFEITKHSSRQIEGKGTLRLKRASGSMRKQAGLRAHVFAPFDSARALIVRGKSYLVDSKAVGAVSKWLERRDGTLVLRDLLGQRIEIPQHFYGVRMVKVGDLREDHPFARVSAFIRARFSVSTTVFDLMIALFSGISDPKTAGIWRQFLSTAAAIVPDFTAGGMGEGLLNEIMVRLEVDRAILSLYEGILEIPLLASFAERWFRFGELDTTVSGDFLPISEETIARVGEMSLEEMTRVIEGTGLLPAGEKDRQAWVDEWMRFIDRRPPTMLWQGFAEWYGWLQKRAKYLPEPFKFVGAIVNKADGEDILALRMAARRFFAEQTVGRLGEEGIAHFALLFLFEHQRLIADVFKDRVNPEPDELELSDGAPLALLAGREAFSDHDVKALATLAREFLRLRGTLTKQAGEILGDGVAAMFGRILMHKDALMIHNFSGMIAGMIQDLPNIREFLTENDPAKDFYGQETVESYVFDDFSHHWPFFERMLGFEPLELNAMSAEIDRAIDIVRRAAGGSGGMSGGGGGFDTSGSGPGSGPGGFESIGEDEGGPSTASSEGLSDGAELYLQMEAAAMGVASPAFGAASFAIPFRPATIR